MSCFHVGDSFVEVRGGLIGEVITLGSRVIGVVPARQL